MHLSCIGEQGLSLTEQEAPHAPSLAIGHHGQTSELDRGADLPETHGSDKAAVLSDAEGSYVRIIQLRAQFLEALGERLGGSG